MQVVSNGECCALLNHQRLPKSERDKPAINVVRMEVIDNTHLPFLKVATPTDRQVRQLYADLLEWTVEQFTTIKDQWPPEASQLALDMTRWGGTEHSSETTRILAGEDTRVVLAGWIAGPDLDPVPKSRTPRP